MIFFCIRGSELFKLFISSVFTLLDILLKKYTLFKDVLDSLGELYSLLCEEDLWAGLWQKHAHYKETNVAIAFEQHGFYDKAQTAYEAAMAKLKADSSTSPSPNHTEREIMLWSNHWIR